MRRILIATRNQGKQREIREIVRALPYDFVLPDDLGLLEERVEETIESAHTFEGNATRKAEYFLQKSLLTTIAEDSGLEVRSLGGAPGVRSRRFALPADDQDAANNAELLRRLAGAPEARRQARYRCVLVLLTARDAMPKVFEGSCAGHILTEPRGSGGFGYDPLFFSTDLGKTFGEATPEEKHAVSHRGRAFAKLVEWLTANPLGPY